MTEEQYTLLSKYDKDLTNAVKASFIHLTPSEFEEIISTDLLDKPLTKSQRNCNTCRLTALRKIGKLFLEEKAKRDTKTEEEARSDVPKKKGGRPKKLKMED